MIVCTNRPLRESVNALGDADKTASERQFSDLNHRHTDAGSVTRGDVSILIDGYLPQIISY